MKEFTIKDIAQKAGVSISTVSRVMNDNYPVSKIARERVCKIIKELDYRPNAIARSLRSNHTNLVALIVADISNQFFMQIAKGLEKQIETIGKNLLIAASSGSAEKEIKIINTFIERKIDGLVIASSGSKSINEIKKCLKFHIPVVLIDRAIPDINVNQVLWDDYRTSYNLVNRLVQEGHRKIGIVNVTLSHYTGTRRFAGYKQALTDAGIPLSERFISPSNFNEEDAYNWVLSLLSSHDRPTAIFCVNNIMTDGTLRAMRDLSLSVGTDISIVAFGQPLANTYLSVKIPYAQQDSLLMGKTAGKLLIQIIKNEIDGQIPQTIIIPSPILDS